MAAECCHQSPARKVYGRRYARWKGIGTSRVSCHSDHPCGLCSDKIFFLYGIPYRIDMLRTAACNFPVDRRDGCGGGGAAHINHLFFRKAGNAARRGVKESSLMDYGIIFALLSLLFAGLNDVIFKRYSHEDRSIGIYVFGIGIIWTLLQAVTFSLKDIPLSYDAITLVYGLSAGVFLVLSNILFLESLTHIDVSLGSTIYRLNTIGVIILSFFVLKENFGLLKYVGISFGILAVLFLYRKEDTSCRTSRFRRFFWIAVMASLFRATYGVVSKAGIMLEADPQTMLLIGASSWIAGGIFYAVLRERQLRITATISLYAALSGALVFFIVNFLILAIERSQASIVIPIANMSFIIALFVSVALKMETLSFKKTCSVATAAVAIILLSIA